MARENTTYLYRWRAALLEADLPFPVKGLLFILSMYADSNTGQNARPGVERLARVTTLDERNVRRHLKTATERGWLRREGGGHNKRAVNYSLTVPVGGRQRPPSDPLHAGASARLADGEGGRQRPEQVGTSARPGGQIEHDQVGAPRSAEGGHQRPPTSQENPVQEHLVMTSSSTSARGTTPTTDKDTPTMPTIDEPHRPPDTDDDTESRALIRLLLKHGFNEDDRTAVLAHVRQLTAAGTIHSPRGWLATRLDTDPQQLLDDARHDKHTSQASSSGQRCARCERPIHPLQTPIHATTWAHSFQDVPEIAALASAEWWAGSTPQCDDGGPHHPIDSLESASL